MGVHKLDPSLDPNQSNLTVVRNTEQEEQKFYLTKEGEITTKADGNEEIQSGHTYYEQDGKFFSSKIEGSQAFLGLASNPNKFFEEQEAKKDQVNQQAHQNLTNTENQLENKEKNDKINDLMNQLNDTQEQTKTLQELVQQLKDDLSENREQNSKILEELKEAKKNPDTNKNENLIQRYKDLIKKLGNERRKKQEKIKEEIKKYPPDEIATLDNGLLRGGLSHVGVMSIRKGIGISYNWEKISLRSRTRRKLNKTIRKLNEIKDDPKRGVKYIMSKTRKRGGGKIGAWIKRGYNSLTIRDTDKFDKVFNEQKKFFIDDLEEKIKANYNTGEEYKASNDYKSIKAIKKRIDYYQDAYKRKMITV